MVFVVERRTSKFLTTKQDRIVLGCALVYCDHENFSTNWPKIHCSRKFYPPKNTRYTVFHVPLLRKVMELVAIIDLPHDEFVSMAITSRMLSIVGEWEQASCSRNDIVW